MDYEKLKLALLHREAVEAYYITTESNQRTTVDYEGNITPFIACTFCGHEAELNHYVPNLAVFDKLIEESNLHALAKHVFILTPSCRSCSVDLDGSQCYTLADQIALAKARSNGVFKRKD